MAFFVKEVKNMSKIQINHLSFGYENSFEEVFHDVNITLDSDWKLGLIGRNGKGKTTLLSLLMGKYDYQGNIICDTKMQYFPFLVDDKQQMTLDVVYQVSPAVEDWMIIRELNYLEVDAEVLYRPFETLSFGEQNKVLLASLFLNNHDFVLIDEPTNHLDLHGREIVAQYLQKKKGFILVSHDRHFLDMCIDRILVIQPSGLELQAGNYSTWKENFDRRIQFEMTQDQKLQKDISKLQQAAKKTANWADQVEKSKFGNGPVDRGFIGHKSAKMMQRSKNIENRRNKAIEQKKQLLKNVQEIEDLKLSPLEFHKDRLIYADNLQIQYENNTVFQNLSFELHQHERLCVIGKNGCGKSSLLKLILNHPIDYDGNLKVASGLKISYVSQDTTNLVGTMDEFIQQYNLDEPLFKAILRKLDFSRDKFLELIENFSSGQKKKILIAKSLCEKAHLYIWDEPLNYIDIDSRIQIENLIKMYQPTLIFVEHDKEFQNQIATRYLHIV